MSVHQSSDTQASPTISSVPEIRRFKIILVLFFESFKHNTTSALCMCAAGGGELGRSICGEGRIPRKELPWRVYIAHIVKELHFT